MQLKLSKWWLPFTRTPSTRSSRLASISRRWPLWSKWSRPNKWPPSRTRLASSKDCPATSAKSCHLWKSSKTFTTFSRSWPPWKQQRRRSGWRLQVPFREGTYWVPIRMSRVNSFHRLRESVLMWTNMRKLSHNHYTRGIERIVNRD